MINIYKIKFLLLYNSCTILLNLFKRKNENRKYIPNYIKLKVDIMQGLLKY